MLRWWRGAGGVSGCPKRKPPGNGRGVGWPRRERPAGEKRVLIGDPLISEVYPASPLRGSVSQFCGCRSRANLSSKTPGCQTGGARNGATHARGIARLPVPPVSRLPTLARPGLYITSRPVPAFDTHCDHHRFSRSLSNSTCRISQSCVISRCHPLLTVRPSHVSRELLQHIAPPRSTSHHRIRLPACAVSGGRDSKAPPLPDVMPHHATDYHAKGGQRLDALPDSVLSLDAVTRLSYAVTPGFPRCRPSQTSPLGPTPFLTP